MTNIDNKFSCPDCHPQKKSNPLFLVIFIVLIFLLFILNQFNILPLLNLNSQSSLPLFFLLGVLASLSSCSAIVGGLLLSISLNWPNFKSHLLFNLSRIITFIVLGGLLGLLGSFINISSSFFPIIIVVVSLIMIYFSLPLLGINFPKISLFPKKLFNKTFSKNLSPIVFGILTFLLPCGFTFTAQSSALISANPLRGSLILLLFVLGTTPSLLFIGFFSSKLFKNPAFSKKFSILAGILILFFALSNLFTQTKNLFPSKNNSLVTISDQKQIINMIVTNSAYSPNYFEVKTNTPIIWQITPKGVTSCTTTIVSPLILDKPINLLPYQTTSIEFTIKKPGTYRFFCSMGMVTGIIKAVD
jgi:uncharacterized protein